MKADRREDGTPHVPVAKATGHGSMKAEGSEVSTAPAPVAKRPEVAA